MAEASGVSESEDRILSVLSVGLVALSEDGTIFRINTQAQIELDISDEAVVGRNAVEFFGVYHDDKDILLSSLKRVVCGDNVELPGGTYIRSWGSHRKFYVKGQLVGEFLSGKLNQIYFLFRNIEGELTQEYILNMALVQTNIFPWFFDIEQNRMTVDPRWFSHLGIPGGDGSLSAEEFAALVHPDDRDMLLGALASQVEGQLNTDLFTYRLRRSDGSWEWFREKSVYLGKIANAPYRIVGVCQSIQDHKEIEANLIAARDKAQESDRLKSAFLANMSHEIRTPLNAIVGFSNLLTSDDMTLDAEQRKDYSRLIEVNSEQLLMLISDVLDLSKIESNTMEFNYADHSLNLLLSDLYAAQLVTIPECVELSLELPKEDIILNTDAMRLKQVVGNLLNNAVKFTERGSVRFGCRAIPASSGADAVEFFVEDTGKGIPKELQVRIFERFFKVNSFTPGAGLGLAICKTIIDSMGGEIQVDSVPGKGACFLVRFPMTRR